MMKYKECLLMNFPIRTQFNKVRCINYLIIDILLSIINKKKCGNDNVMH